MVLPGYQSLLGQELEELSPAEFQTHLIPLSQHRFRYRKTHVGKQQLCFLLQGLLVATWSLWGQFQPLAQGNGHPGEKPHEETKLLVQESQGMGWDRSPHGAFHSHSSILSGKQREERAPWAQPSSHPTTPHPTIALTLLWFITHQHSGAPAFILQAPSTSVSCSPNVPSPEKQLLSVTALSGRSWGEEMFVQAGVTAIACYRPGALLSWQGAAWP